MEPKIDIEDFTYNLPDDKIAKYPLPERDASKILIYKGGVISESKFSNITEFIPLESIIIFNNTKVVPARLIFRKESGAKIEIFCLEPFKPAEYVNSFSSRKECSWVAVVGNAKRWKSGLVHFNNFDNEDAAKINLKAQCEERKGDKYIIKFSWSGDLSFSEVLEICGKVPIPPYLHRDAQESDRERYQTLYAKERGSVAAPTAGLHFTKEILNKISGCGICMGEICLHVGAGTFIPVKSREVSEHKMHSEPFSVSLSFIKDLHSKVVEKKSIVAVGTTCVRSIESLYYLGLQTIRFGKPGDVSQWEPYSCDETHTAADMLKALIDWMELSDLQYLERRTEIIIVPGYKFKFIDVLITNFHQPQSTLLLLISAFTGDGWRDIYNYALENDFRFLSYGDSSIIFR